MRPGRLTDLSKVTQIGGSWTRVQVLVFQILNSFYTHKCSPKHLHFWLSPTQLKCTRNSNQAVLHSQLTPEPSCVSTPPRLPAQELGGAREIELCLWRLLCRGETCSHRFKLELNSNIIPALGGLLLKIEPQREGTFHFSHAKEISRLTLWQILDALDVSLLLAPSWPTHQLRCPCSSLSTINTRCLLRPSPQLATHSAQPESWCST